jgi:SPP1 family predicted phage head-tail adaptor
VGIGTVAAGRLEQRVTLQQRVAGVNALGQASNSWASMLDVWAAVEPLRGREFFAAGQTQSEVTTRITIRWRQGVTSAMRVVWRGQPFDIIAVVEPEGQRQTLELMCVQGVADGR